MKKFLVVLSMAVCAVFVNAKEKYIPVSIETGSIAFLSDASNVIDFVADYSASQVQYDGNSYTLPGYLEHRGADFVAGWAEDSIKAHNIFAANFNRTNKKGAKAFLTNEGTPNYFGTIYVSDIDFGNGGASFIPFGGAKAGGAMLSGKIVFKDNDGKEVAVLPFNYVCGIGHPSESVRFTLTYFELAKQLSALIKQETKKK